MSYRPFLAPEPQGPSLFSPTYLPTYLPTYRMPGRKNPGSYNYEHFGWTVLLTDDAIKQISVYLEGPAPDQQQQQHHHHQHHDEGYYTAEEGDVDDDDAHHNSSQTEAELEEMVKEGIPISLATVSAVDGPASVEEILHVAQNPRNLAAMVKSPGVGGFQHVEEDINALLATASEVQLPPPPAPLMRRRSSAAMIVSVDAKPEVTMEESILKGM